MPLPVGNQLGGRGYSIIVNTLLIPFFFTDASCDAVINRPLPASLSLITHPNLDGLSVNTLRMYRYKSPDNDNVIQAYQLIILLCPNNGNKWHRAVIHGITYDIQ